MTFREFNNTDAVFCFRMRSSAFIEKFYDEIGAEAVSLGVNAYMPEDYIKMTSYLKIFILEDDGERAGFLTVKKTEYDAAEIPFIYFDLHKLGRGYGVASIKYIEEWVKANWNSVSTIIIDTIIPKYNGGFYEKMGYKKTGRGVCTFFNKDVPATRFEKRIK
ncbi:MAG: hypothetical protein C0412_09755 [Flavobacterium sp.]|nr:hypothetical protein [Flavobacterium sp.]